MIIHAQYVVAKFGFESKNERTMSFQQPGCGFHPRCACIG
jgi:hypothetical protein